MAGLGGVYRSCYILCTCCFDIGLKTDELTHCGLHGLFLQKKTVFFLKLSHKNRGYFCKKHNKKEINESCTNPF